jgi:hypothetical protein
VCITDIKWYGASSKFFIGLQNNTVAATWINKQANIKNKTKNLEENKTAHIIRVDGTK